MNDPLGVAGLAEDLAASASAGASADVDADIDWRVVVAADGVRHLVDAFGQFVLDLEGRPVCLNDDGGLYVVNQAGAHVSVDASADFLAPANPDAASMHAAAPSANSSAADVPSAGVSLDGDIAGADETNPPAASGHDHTASTHDVGIGNGGQGDTVAGGVGGSVDITAEGPALDASVSIEPGRPAVIVGGGVGITLTGRPSAVPSLVALIDAEGTLALDGVQTHLDQLGPITQLAPEGDAPVVSNPHLSIDAQIDGPVVGGEANLVVHLQGGVAPVRDRGSLRVHLVIDRSSSMQSTWGEVMAAGDALIAHLRPQDRIQIVGYGTGADEVLSTQLVGNGDAARRALALITVGGGTNIEAGLEVAYADAMTRPRASGERDLVILLSDGVPNHGAFGADELGPMAGLARASAGCTTTVVGLGNQFDADVLRAIATEGEGGYHIARNMAALTPVLEAELDAHLRVAASDVRVQVVLPPGVRLADGDLVHGERTATGAKLELPEVRAGEERRFVLRLSVSAMVSAGAMANVSVSHRSGAGAVQTDSKDVLAAPDRVRARFAVADANLGQAIDLAADAVRNGRAAEAEAVLRAHVSDYGVRAEGSMAPLAHRTAAVGRVATVVGSLTVSASHGERREVANALGALAARLLR